MIQSFSFGRITIDGKVCYSAVIIYPDHIQPEWRRREGHVLNVEDFEEIADGRVFSFYQEI